jgi:hypothetical protein
MTGEDGGESRRACGVRGEVRRCRSPSWAGVKWGKVLGAAVAY